MWELCWRYFSSVFIYGNIFCKVAVNKNTSFIDYASGIRLLDCSKWAKSIWCHNFLIWRHRHIFLTRFCFSSQVSISGDWDELRISSLARMSLIKCYWMLQNVRITAFTTLELLREDQLEGLKLHSLLLTLYPEWVKNVTTPWTQERKLNVHNTFRRRPGPHLNTAWKVSRYRVFTQWNVLVVCSI